MITKKGKTSMKVKRTTRAMRSSNESSKHGRGKPQLSMIRTSMMSSWAIGTTRWGTRRRSILHRISRILTQRPAPELVHNRTHLTSWISSKAKRQSSLKSQASNAALSISWTKLKRKKIRLRCVGLRLFSSQWAEHTSSTVGRRLGNARVLSPSNTTIIELRTWSM